MGDDEYKDKEMSTAFLWLSGPKCDINDWNMYCCNCCSVLEHFVIERPRGIRLFFHYQDVKAHSSSGIVWEKKKKITLIKRKRPIITLRFFMSKFKIKKVNMAPSSVQWHNFFWSSSKYKKSQYVPPGDNVAMSHCHPKQPLSTTRSTRSRSGSPLPRSSSRAQLAKFCFGCWTSCLGFLWPCTQDSDRLSKYNISKSKTKTKTISSLGTGSLYWVQDALNQIGARLCPNWARTAKIKAMPSRAEKKPGHNLPNLQPETQGALCKVPPSFLVPCVPSLLCVPCVP